MTASAAEVGRTGGHVLAKRVFKSSFESLPEIRDFVGKWAAEVGVGEEQTYRINWLSLRHAPMLSSTPRKKATSPCGLGIVWTGSPSTCGTPASSR